MLWDAAAMAEGPASGSENRMALPRERVWTENAGLV
jgi:hypothetical protein